MNKETKSIVETLTSVTWHLTNPVSIHVVSTRGYKDKIQVVRGNNVLCFVQDRVLYGEGTRALIPIVTGHEWVSLQTHGLSYPDVGGGPFLGRGWLGRLGRVTLRYITRGVSS